MINPKFNRAKWKEGIKKRQQESYEKREDSGKFRSIFIDPIGRDKFWKPTVGEHQINIIPFIAGKNNPNTPEGDPSYVLDIWVHSGVGVNEDQYVCPARNFDQPCPICEHQTELRKEPDYDEDYVKSLSPKRRVVYNIEVLDSPKEQNKGVQLFEVSHFSFEKPLMERSKLPKGGGYVYFADVDDGQIVSFDVKEAPFTTKGPKPKTIKKMDYVSFQFIPRDSPIPDDLLTKTHCLDEIVKIPTYDELYEAFFQESKEKHVEEEKEELNDVPEPEMEDAPEQETPGVAEDECPVAQIFGADFDKFNECDTCINREECAAKKLEIDEAKKTKVTAKPSATPKGGATTSPLRRRPGR